MIRRRRAPVLLAAAAVLAVAAVAAVGAAHRPVVEVRAGADVSAAIASARRGTVVRLLPGWHRPFTVSAPVRVEGVRGATVRGPVVVAAAGASLRRLAIVGGESGVSVRGVEGVRLTEVRIRGADLHGIEVVEGSALIESCGVAALSSADAQGIEVRNSAGRPRTRVLGCRVSSGHEGIVSHVSRVEVRGNVVTGTTARGIAVIEMSEGLVQGNRVEDVAGVALYCGDMSNCDVRGNVVRGVRPDAWGISRGEDAVATHHSVMRFEGNRVSRASGPRVRVSENSGLTEASPLALWPPGWRGAGRPLLAGAVGLLTLLAVRWGADAWLRRRRGAGRLRRRGRAAEPGGPDEKPPVVASLLTGASGTLLRTGFALATFHMAEHVVQVHQVYVAQAEGHGGILGSVFDGEWLHFSYNLALLGFLTWLAWRAGRAGWAARHGAGPHAARRRLEFAEAPGASFLLAALAIQAYHLVEHAAKLVQHVAGGFKVGPGLLGARLGLVSFHFGINLAVWAGLAVALASVLLAARAERDPGPRPGRLPAPVGA